MSPRHAIISIQSSSAMIGHCCQREILETICASKPSIVDIHFRTDRPQLIVRNRLNSWRDILAAGDDLVSFFVALKGLNRVHS